MEIKFKKGSKNLRDRIIQITTTQNEPFSIFKLCQLANQLAINELIINKDSIEKYNNFLFKKAVISSIEMAEEGIDWAIEENIQEVAKWCNKHYLKFEFIEPELMRMIQKRLMDYEKP